MSTPTVYISHPFSAPEAMDSLYLLQNAEQWFGFIAQRYRCIPRAPWMVLVRVWDEETGRSLGLEIDCEEVRRCDVLAQCGDRVQAGGRKERAVARHTIDLTCFGRKLPPTDEDTLREMDELFRCAGIERRK